jgi:phosphatidylglycerol:prolipoprotein diacylglycerol transferase
MFSAFRSFFFPPRHLVLLLLAGWLGLHFAERRTERCGVGREDLNNLIYYGLLAFVVGGRLFFVLQNLPIFAKSPLDLVSINIDLFDLSGAAASALVVSLVYGQRRGLRFWNALDALTPFFAVLAVGLGLSRLAAGAAFGAETDLPWGVELWGAKRHPTQGYETAASLIIFALVWFQRQARSGVLFLSFAALTAASQIFIQGFRGDSALFFGGLRLGQMAAWAALAGVFVLFEYRLKKET